MQALPVYLPLGGIMSASVPTSAGSDARIVENGFAASSGVSKSAKVVLGPTRDPIGSVARLLLTLPVGNVCCLRRFRFSATMAHRRSNAAQTLEVGSRS
jgi:hypothetical protein